MRRLTRRRRGSVYSTPRREGCRWMLLVASCIYVCFMSACILHLRRCHVWWLSAVLSLSLSLSLLFLLFYLSEPLPHSAFRLFPFSRSSPPSPPSLSLSLSLLLPPSSLCERRCLHFLTFLKPRECVSHLVVTESLNSKKRERERERERESFCQRGAISNRVPPFSRVTNEISHDRRE